MEKIRTIPPQKDIRSDIVKTIHSYEQFLNDQVIHLRTTIKENHKNNPYVASELTIVEQHLNLFRHIFSSYLPQTEEKNKLPSSRKLNQNKSSV